MVLTLGRSVLLEDDIAIAHGGAHILQLTQAVSTKLNG